MSEQSASKWRESIQETVKRGGELQLIAEKLPGEFEVRPDWPGIDWCVWGESMEDFGKRVRFVAEVLGPPDCCEGKHWLGAYSDDRPPDLIATWERREPFVFQITVRALSPEGCKTDPRTAFREKEEPKLHPECVASLRQLEEAMGSGR